MNNFVLHMTCPRQFPHSGVVSPLFRNPAWKWDLLWTAIQELKFVWPDVISYLWFVFVLVSDGTPKPPIASGSALKDYFLC